MRDCPRTVADAVDYVVSLLSEENKRKVREASESGIQMLNFTLGTFVRNVCGLWQENTELLRSCGDEDMHPDSASVVIVKAMHERLNAELCGVGQSQEVR
jgi:hypothetical protein